ncbi:MULTISPECIES: response regulator [unclassified Tolypothrix]|uniref:response regulator n=1 Tax=unclassified Tolypothrix TaxID=2649714 RepID=UPI0005EABAB7|nr:MULTISPECIES: response regulator [unclassified Tolypothrix]BAY90270.1 response regulator receiver protein [Microchaete diplosiphon NIES-3275]EKE98899.1 response regulator [Tolypothrix sp. PCC 7601]MBE9083372.1 response regulator [Tolypothrix sp. LEGE 11397]UYD24461.1 response regulator [Tolypothrix sp. PCC 7712]UYD33307.1 response regulator [Tolypothrix sp. PCC 7601]
MSSHNRLKVLKILLVEDSKSDAVLIAETLSESKFLNQLNIVRDGAEASDYLYRRGKYKDVNRPDLILLDLNLPKKNGRELLAEIKADDNLKTIPIVILTTSSAETDILKSYQLNVNCYLVKPVDLEQFVAVVKSIEHFWLALVELPAHQNS